MNEATRNDTRRKVTSVGNSWIICESRSHPGLTYYFNTLTGEAVWNISESQIEKAKRETKRLENLQGGELMKWPEPKDKPPPTLKKSAKPSVPSEQFVINKFSEQSSVLTYTNMENSNATFHTPCNQISGLMQGANNRFLNTTTTVYNPNVWDPPYTQQVFIAPAIAPAVTHNQGPLNVALSQTVSQPATGLVFNNFTNASQTITSGRTFYPRESHDQGIKRTMTKKNEFLNKKDLRQKLTKIFKKQSVIPGVSGSLTANINPRKADFTTHFVNQVEGIHSKDLGSGTESICEEKQLNTVSKIDLGPLKRLATPDSNSDAWYIIVDLEVLLNAFKFLTTLTDSDKNCYLMVPKRVMEELKAYVTCTEVIQAKRILRFVSHQIDIGYAYLAKEPSNVKDDSMAEAILATCQELLDDKYHVILLSNDNEILEKCPSNINIFSIAEVKNFLMENSKLTCVSPGTNKPFMTDELINKIKIIVPNDVPHNKETRDTQSDNIPPKQNNTPDKPDELKVQKCTVDAGIQTDLEEINASTVKVVEKQPPNTISNTKETITRRSVSLVSNTSGKKREIHLKRCISHQPTINSDETPKKQFKWRRRRNTSQDNDKILSNNKQNNTDNVGSQKILSINKQNNTNNVESQNILSNNKQNNTNNVASQSNTLNNEIYKLPDRTLDNNPALRIENKISDESIASKDSSIDAEPKATTKENITIAETSTSSIISNTESHVDDDSTYSTNSINQQQVYHKVMYKVESITMEKYLTDKLEEWVSRFIQIMEEVLSQVLLQDPKFTHKAMPPPWTLHEAAQCIVMKFRGNQGIAAAANELSNILFQVSNDRGRIKEITPVQYMQMYSYSVHLLDEIMEVATSCEDIQIAVESLNKLLDDIRNPNMESSNNAFCEDKQDDIMSSNYVSANSDDDDDEISLHEEEMLLECRTEEVRNDKPKENIPCEEELQKPIKFIRRIDIPSPLKKSLCRQINNEVNKEKSPVQYSETQRSTVVQQGEGNNSQNAKKTPERENDSDVPTNQPTIIRKFSICPMLEQKLRKNYNEQRNDTNEEKVRNNYKEQHHDATEEKIRNNYKEQHHDATEEKIRNNYKEQLQDATEEKVRNNYKEQRHDPTEEKIRNNNKEQRRAATEEKIRKKHKEQRHDATEDKIRNNYNEQRHKANGHDQTDKGADTTTPDEPESLNDADSPIHDENNKKFKYMMHTFLQEIKDALSQVQALCEQCYEEFLEPDQSIAQKYQLQKRAERAQLHVLRLSRSLESMLEHEANHPTQSMSALLAQADIDINHVDAELLVGYRIAVEKCKTYTDEFLSSIANIISDVTRVLGREAIRHVPARNSEKT